MIEFDALKRNWQNQKLTPGKNLDPEKITSDSLSKLKKFEKMQFRINMGKTTMIILMILFLVYTMLIATPLTALKLTAVCWIVFSVIYFLVVYWKMQLKVNKLNMQGNSLDFIDEVLKNFAIQRKFFKDKIWIFGAALVIGINILYLDVLKALTIIERLYFHLGFTVLMVLVLWLGIKFRMFRFRREYDPIINELTKIKEDLKDNK